MKIIDEIYELEDFCPWSGARTAYDKIIDADKGEEFMSKLEDVYEDGITQTQLNDLLWFEPEWCYQLVGLNSDGVKPLNGNDVINGSNRICEAIENKLHDWYKEHDREGSYDILSEWDFEESLDEWLIENQGDCTNEDELAENWLEDVGNDAIDEAISDLLND